MDFFTRPQLRDFYSKVEIRELTDSFKKRALTDLHISKLVVEQIFGKAPQAHHDDYSKH